MSHRLKERQFVLAFATVRRPRGATEGALAPPPIALLQNASATHCLRLHFPNDDLEVAVGMKTADNECLFLFVLEDVESLVTLWITELRQIGPTHRLAAPSASS